jgi:hypothetical protein
MQKPPPASIPRTATMGTTITMAESEPLMIAQRTACGQSTLVDFKETE